MDKKGNSSDQRNKRIFGITDPFILEIRAIIDWLQTRFDSRTEGNTDEKI